MKTETLEAVLDDARQRLTHANAQIDAVRAAVGRQNKIVHADRVLLLISQAEEFMGEIREALND